MESFILLIIGAVLFAQGWNLLRVVDLRTVGFLAAGGALGLLSVITIGDIAVETDAPRAMVVTYAVLVALYAGVLAGVGLWDFDDRTLGLYSIFLAVATLGFGATFLQIVGDIDGSLLMGSGSLILATIFAVLFVALVPPLRKTYQTVTGYVVLIGSAILAIIGLGSLTGILDIEETV